MYFVSDGMFDGQTVVKIGTVSAERFIALAKFGAMLLNGSSSGQNCVEIRESAIDC